MPHKDPIERKEWERAYRRKNLQRDKARKYAATLRWRSKNYERFMAIQRRWRSANKVKLNAAWMEKYRLNPEKRKPYRESYKKRHPDRIRLSQQVTQAKRGAARGKCSTKQWLARLEYYGRCCAYCLKSGRLEMDHVIPLLRGGTHWPSNIVPACRSCNAKKHSKFILPLRLKRFMECREIAVS